MHIVVNRHIESVLLEGMYNEVCFPTLTNGDRHPSLPRLPLITLQVLYTRFTTVPSDTTIGKVSQILDKRHFVLVTSEQRCYTGAEVVETKTTIFSIVTRIDILNFIMKREDSGGTTPK